MSDLFCANCLTLGGGNSPKAVTIFDGRAVCAECLRKAKSRVQLGGGGGWHPDHYPGAGGSAIGWQSSGGVVRQVVIASDSGGGSGVLVAPFPPHDGSGPDVNPATGDERETTEGPADE